MNRKMLLCSLSLILLLSSSVGLMAQDNPMQNQRSVENRSARASVDVRNDDDQSFPPVSNLQAIYYSNTQILQLKWTAPAVKNDWSYNVYRDGHKIANVDVETFEEKYSVPGYYSYQVEVQYPNGVSPMAYVYLIIPAADPDPNTPAMIVLKAENVWGDGTGYQILFDETATAFGDAIPQSGPLTQTCDVPEGLEAKFTHRVPEAAKLSCMPEDNQWVVDGEATALIPAGVYDLCVSNPEPGRKIWIASGKYGRIDNVIFRPGVRYTFRIYLDGSNDAVEVEPSPEIMSGVDVHSTIGKLYAAEGSLFVEIDESAELSLFDLQGRRILTQLVAGKVRIAVKAGTYVAQLKMGNHSQSTKLIVR